MRNSNKLEKESNQLKLKGILHSILYEIIILIISLTIVVFLLGGVYVYKEYEEYNKNTDHNVIYNNPKNN